MTTRTHGDRTLRAMTLVMLALVGVLTTLRACHLFHDPSVNWHGPFGTVDYTKDPGAMRYVLGLMERDR